MEYTREKLIDICERAIVPHDEWADRDTAGTQEGIGKSLVFLKAGCKFEVKTEENTRDGSGCITDDRTIWIQFWVRGWNYFEFPSDEETDGIHNSDYFFYLPTEKRLNEPQRS